MNSNGWRLLALLLLLVGVDAQSRARFVDNDVVGDPKIECEADKIVVHVTTSNIFVGNMYIRGHFLLPECRAAFSQNQEPNAHLSVKLNDCGMIRTEHSNPNGVNYRVDVVVSFHPFFETRQDEAYSVDCFYKNEQINVNSKMAVNESAALRSPPESNLHGIVENNCDYSIRVESVGGPLVRFTEIGQPVVHRWECEDPSMGILVKDCYAQSESMFNEQVIDNRGCAIPGFFEEITYNSQLTMAFVQVETFKFPDVDTIRFSCNISFCNKFQNECLGITPPNCPQVRRSEFVPNSRMDASVDPTRVYAPVDYQFPMKTTKKFSYHGITASTRSPFVFPPMRKMNDYVKDEGPEYVEVLSGKQLPIIVPIASQPVAQALHSSTKSPNLLILKKNRTDKPHFRSMSNERNLRARRAEDNVMSVKAETMFVTDPLEPRASGDHKRSIYLSPEEERILCLNRMSSLITLAVFGVLTSFSLAAAGYIFVDVCIFRNRCTAQITTRKNAVADEKFTGSFIKVSDFTKK